MARGLARRLGQRGRSRAAGGQPNELDQRIVDLMRQAPLSYLITKAVIGPDRATTIFRAVDEASHQQLARAEQRAYDARLWSLLVADLLDAIHSRYGPISGVDLTEFFTTELVPAETAERFARSCELYWQHQYDEAAHVLVPRIESVIREMARRVGIPIIREPRGAKPGGVR